MFSVTEALDNLGTGYRVDRWQAPYRARWAAAEPRNANFILKGHRDVVNAVCAITVNGRPLLATASYDGTVRLWDPATGAQTCIMDSRPSGGSAMWAVTVDDWLLLATAGFDGTVRLWNSTTGQLDKILKARQDRNDGIRNERIAAICAITVDGRPLLATGGHDGTVRLWNPGTGQPYKIFKAHQGRIFALCAVTVDGQPLLAAGGQNKTAQVWNPVTQARIMESHQGGGHGRVRRHG
jgi:WD40 repeat protein